MPSTESHEEYGAAKESHFSRLLRRILQLGSGELLARIFGVVTVIFLGHQFGVVILGVYALAQGIMQCQQPLIDFGLRHVGARLMARFPGSASEIMHRVQRRRVAMAAATLPFFVVYAALARLPFEMKVFLALFAAISAMYALSLDWAAWGREQLRLVGFAKAIIPGSVLICLLIATRTHHVLPWILAGSLFGYSVQAIVFWVWWKRHRLTIGEQEHGVAAIGDALRWQRTSVMGLAWLGNFAFATIDVFMLGILSTPDQVGLYSAAYRILSQVLMTYYLLNNVLYPQLARQTVPERLRMLRPRILLAIFVAGSVVTALVAIVRVPLLRILFGHAFLTSAPLLLVLACVVPLDFLVSYLNSAYIAWSMERKVLVCAVVAASSNVVLNWIGIPRYGALAAAVNTVISYVVYLAGLAIAGSTAKELQPARLENAAS